MSIEFVEISYSVPEAMMQDMAPDTPPIHVSSDRQVGYLLEITKTHGVRLCVSSRSKMRTVRKGKKLMKLVERRMIARRMMGRSRMRRRMMGKRMMERRMLIYVMLLKRSRMVRITVFMERSKMRTHKKMNVF